MSDAMALLLAGGLAWLIVYLIRRAVAKHERIKACNHVRELVDGEFPTYFCAHRCGWQQPARDVYEERRRKRIERCPQCGGDLGDD